MTNTTNFARGTEESPVPEVQPTLFAPTSRPTYSPWGRPDECDEIAPGIWRVFTPSHGGFIISQQRRDRMPPVLRDFQTFAGGNSYEEDCDWAIVALAYPDHFTREQLACARQVFGAFKGSDSKYAAVAAAYPFTDEDERVMAEIRVRRAGGAL